MIVPGLLTASCSRVVKLGVAMIRFSLSVGSSCWLEARGSWRSRGLRFLGFKELVRIAFHKCNYHKLSVRPIIHALCSMSTPYFVHCVLHVACYSDARD